MQFTDNADVYTAEGEKVGDISHVVIEPYSGEVSHLVVERGFLFPDDRVIPVTAIANTSANRVQLKAGFDKDGFLPFTEMTYITPAESEANAPYMESYERPLYAYPPVSAASTGWHAWSPAVFFNHEVAAKENVPEDTIVLEEGADVVSRDDEKVGNVSRVFTRDSDQQITHFVISSGIFFETEKLIPIFWIQSANRDRVKLNVDADTLRRLPEFNADQADLAPNT